MVSLIVGSLYLIFISIITGHVVSKKLGFSPTLIEKSLLGIALSNSFFSVVSLFFPLKPYISLLYLIICFIFFLFDYKSIFKLKLPELIPKNLFFITFAVIVIFGFIYSLYPPKVFDSGLYHIQAIEWIENYPAVPGLGNFHGRFGFNPNIFTLFAATSFEGIVKQDVYSINFVIYCIISIWLLRGIYNFFQLKYYSLGLIFTVSLMMVVNTASIISSPTPDFACYFIPFFILLRFIEIKVLDKSNNVSAYFTIIILSFYILTVKLAALPVILIIPLIIYQNWKDISNKNLYVLVFIVSIIMLPWLLRNIILTGWIIYPFAQIDLFSFDWKIPKPDVIKMSETITAWARDPFGKDFLKSAHMSFGQWFPVWWIAKTTFQKTIFILVCSTPLIVLILIFFQRLKGFMRSYQPVYFIAFIGFVFWFVVAPDWRYGLTFLALPLILTLLFIKHSVNMKNKYLISVVSILIIAYTVYINLTPVDYFIKNIDTIDYIQPLIIKANKNGIVKFDTYRIDDKLDVKFPVDDYRCFDVEIPCSSHQLKNIHLRGDNLGSGFYKE
ncbi:MAG: hypothetical protein M3R36_11940 [Bacteroidota bacterium]|nr:hypothetical protein [Bacteroidota bacterium]